VIPVDQTTFGMPGGNCFSACVASILELPISEVPYFMEPPPGCEHAPAEPCGCWWSGFLDWLAARGLTSHYFKAGDYPWSGHPPGYSIAGGLNASAGLPHAVVALDGAQVHDPNPNRLGLAAVDDYFVIERLPPEALHSTPGDPK
jgi:hypothetical protein